MGRTSDSGSGGRTGKETVKRAFRLLFLVIFICSVFRLLGYYLEYREQEKSQAEAVENYIQQLPVSGRSAEEQGTTGSASGRGDMICPIRVDFEALLAENEDIVGWLYCEGTNINYPVVQGTDNEYYLTHSYDKKESRGGALFVDAKNRPQFADSNTIIYGHHMKNGGMLAHLSDFAEQEYFDAHSVMWLLTPEQTYQVELIGGYLTSADSDSYTIFTGECQEFDEYLSGALAASDVQVGAKASKDGRYIMLSTCEYDFEDARYVLHGRLLPY